MHPGIRQHLRRRDHRRGIELAGRTALQRDGQHAQPLETAAAVDQMLQALDRPA